MRIRTKEDYERLISCIEFDPKWRWVAVDEDGWMFSYLNAPELGDGQWVIKSEDVVEMGEFERDFQFLIDFPWQDSLIEINQ